MNQTQNEIQRTAWRYFEPQPDHTGKRIDRNHVCPSCKNDNTDRVMDAVELNRYRAFYKDSKFHVHDCHLCGARWSNLAE
jgi:hypothetical protein